MSSTQEDLAEIRKIVLDIIKHTEKQPIKIYIAYDSHKDEYANFGAITTPVLEIVWSKE